MEFLRAALFILAPLLIVSGIVSATLAWLRPAVLKSRWFRPYFPVPDRVLKKWHLVQALQIALTGVWVLCSLFDFHTFFVIALLAAIASSLWLMTISRQIRLGAQT